ncbi:MAG: DUF1580 domain-containing protein [Planctomycetes bacterium]|nr:DUF1580 domain-containing protein [Planctomycetota bacterium]
MIDIQNEQVVTLTQATRHLPKRRKGRRPAVSTLFRWAQDGVRGVHLETLQVGGTRCTSLEALQRFFEQLTEVSTREPTPSPSKAQAAAQAERALDAAGI